MNYNDLKQTGGSYDNPCELISRYLLHESNGGTLASFLQEFDFGSREEIEQAIRDFLRIAYTDTYMQQKHLAERNALAAAVFARMRKIYEDQNKIERYPVTTSGEIWHGGYSRQRLDERTRKMFAIKPNAKAYADACERLREVYGLTETDLEKLHFFVEQVKDGAKFPNSLRRMLYLWGNEKKTGKTTTGKILTCLLNGDANPANISHYETNLANELQVGSFKVPKVSECNVCLMDECFFADMGKMYADFKRYITSSNGRARLPFGQEFEWTGCPNYIATSNEPLKVFIKDWNDRRYLSINFATKPKVKMKEAEIVELWMSFVQNSTRTMDWQEWAEEIAPMAEEKGERTEIAEEFESELRKSAMLERFLLMPEPVNKYCADNKITLRVFVNLIAETIGAQEAQKRRGEIEQAVMKIYGERYSNTNYWQLTTIKEIARDLLYKQEPAQEIDEDARVDDDDDLPF